MTSGPRIYNLFPLLCGTIKDWHVELPRIASMKFDWIFVNPFHLPGFSGSLYAVKDYYRYNPLIVPQGEDGDALLREFAASCGEHGIGVMMDLVINHTARDSVLVEQHPEWYLRDADGDLVSPGCKEADGAIVKWEDLAELDYLNAAAREGMIGYWCDLVRHYVGLGVRGYRCDAAYQVPADVWTPLIGAARETCGECVFAAETLGCTPDQVEALRPAGFTYLFNSAAWWDFAAPYLLEQYELYRHFAPSIAFPESHDTDRLRNTLKAKGVIERAHVERVYRAHYLFAAAFSTGVMMPIGYEYGYRKRLHVAETRPGDREQPHFDLTSFITEVHDMKARVPALNEEGPQQQLALDEENGLTCLLRRSNDGRSWTLTAINADPHERHETAVRSVDVDLATAVEITPGRQGARLGQANRVAVDAGEIRVFAGSARVGRSSSGRYRR